MKLNKILFSLMAAFSLMAVSCQEELAYTPGEQDLAGCHGVYFPTQDASGDHNMDPSETPAVDIIVKRSSEDGDITVPVEVIASEEGIFNVPELTFEDGQTETTLHVTFPNAKQGVDYSLSLQITDPEYAAKYGANPTFITYNVVIVKFEMIGKALYREDLLSTLFTLTPANPEWEVEVYTKNTEKGVYYLKNVYQPGVCPLFKPDGQVTETMMKIDASDPQKVILPFTYLGCNLGYGECAAGSYAPEGGFNVAPEAALYGTLINNVITFPKDGLLFGMSEYNNFGFYLANSDEMFRVALPGAVLTDFTIKLRAGFSNKGQQPVYFTFGPDVATIKYAAYEGPLGKLGLAEKIAEISADANAKTVARPAADAEGNVPDAAVNVSFDETGEYTIVAVGCDKDGVPQSSEYLLITYVAADDEEGVPVVVGAGLGSAAKYANQGISTESALEFYVYGEDLVDIKVGLFKYADLVADQNACIKAVMASESAPAKVVDEANEDVYVDVFTGLMPGTEYYLLTWASNGYEQKLILSDPWTTDGDPLPVYQSFDYTDIDGKLLPAKSEGYFGTYNYYAQNAGPLREYIGQVTIADSEYPDQGPDEDGLYDEFVEISGLFGGLAKEYGVKDDTMIFDYYAGVIYALENPLGPGSHPQLGSFYVGMSMGNTKPSVYPGNDYLMIGGFVDEGYLAFVTAPSYANAGYTMDSFFLMACSDAECQEPLGYLDYITDPLLVDPKVDDNGLAPAPKKASLSRANLNQLNFSIATDINYVETERGRIRSIIDKMNAENKAPKSVGTIAGVKGEYNAASVEFSAEEAAPQLQSKTTDFSKVNDAKPVLYR